MALFSFLKRKEPARRDTPAGAASPEAIQQARTQARRRLIGAAVLVAVGVIGFPLLFETTPRPIPVDIPIEIPSRQGVAPVALPQSRGQAAQGTVAGPAGSAGSAVAAASPGRVMPPVITERADEQGREVQPSRAAASPAAASAAADKPKPAADDGARAKALLEGAQDKAKVEPKSEPKAAVKPEPKPPAVASSAAGATGRFVVQVGAFGEASSASDARQRLEKLGLKTYTQEVQVDGQRRIRVRVGPFDNRADAEKAAARIKGGGLPAALLAL